MTTYKVVFVDNSTKEREVQAEFSNLLEACDYIDELEALLYNEHNVSSTNGKFKVDTYK